jgi:hypothetical protein
MVNPLCQWYSDYLAKSRATSPTHSTVRKTRMFKGLGNIIKECRRKKLNIYAVNLRISIYRKIVFLPVLVKTANIQVKSDQLFL